MNKIYFHERVEGKLKLRTVEYGSLDDNLELINDQNVASKIVSSLKMKPSGAVMCVVK